MAASMPWLPFPFGPQIPVTPPPDHQSFSLAQGPPPLSPNLLKSFTQEIYGHGNSLLSNSLSGGLSSGLSGLGGGLKGSGLQGRNMMMANSQQRPLPGSVAAGVNGSTKHVFPPPPPPLQRQQHQQIKTEPKEPPATTAPPSTTTAPSASDKTAADGSTTTGAATTETKATTASAAPSEGGPLSASDPRYLAMASRIAAYYHQRCQAVANFQQQRCQAWANMQRQKSQEMTQAAMLVVAWYIRDRIQRRRRREKRQFRRGLAAKAAGNNNGVVKGGKGVRRAGSGGPVRVTKGEAVRKWVLQVPEGSTALSPNTPGARDRPADPDEVSFDIDRDTVSDKDMRLYNVADNLIKSQLARIDVPMMGALSFDASESESDSEEEEEGDEEDEGDDVDNDDDEPVGPGAHNDEDDIMVNYEERGAPIEAVAVGVEAMITDATAKTAVRAGLGAGAGAAPRSACKHEHHPDDDEEYYMEDDDDYDFEDDDDEEFEEEDYEDEDGECGDGDDDGQQVSELVHHGTGAGSGSSGSRQQTSSFS
ncbi:hypothetical protein Sste5346_002329 [Sporothrix stenoceras]|uniref:Uncharacterized protein n=1 Tax=Sporothrix stenoceras TaxID=5173 RepID=A0ABR3ZIW4_9PEZI